jgi:probable phosphoglycerate mutase
VATRVYLIRHGATELSAEDRFAGAVDVLLSDGGRDQARRLGDRLAAEPISVAFASPMKRTMETARLVAEPHGIPVTPVDGESGLQVTARALPAILDIVEQHCDKQILIVSHKATIRLLLSSLLGFDARKYRDRLDQAPCALNILDFKSVAHARLTLFNDTSHYTLTVPDVPANRLSKVWDDPTK